MAVTPITFPNGQVFTSSAQSQQQIQSVFQQIVIQIYGNLISNVAPPFNDNPWNAPPGSPVWQQVRVGFQQQGQPSWDISEDVCIITAYTENEEYSWTREAIFQSNAVNTTGSAALKSTSLVVASATGITANQSVSGVGIAPGTLVSSISGTTVTLSAPTTAALSGTAVSFFSTVTQQMEVTQVWRVHFTFYGPNAYPRAALVLSAMSFDWVCDLLAESNLYPIVRWYRPIHNNELFEVQWWTRVDLTLKFNEQVNESLVIPAAASSPVTIVSNEGPSVSLDIQA